MSKPRLMRNRFTNVHMLQVDEVVDLDSLIDFLNSRVGTPRPLAKDKGVVSKHAKEFFKQYPEADWRALTDLANWARAKNKHLNMIKLVASWRYAYEDGYMRILQRGNSTNDDDTLQEMLKNVSDHDVRQQMIGAATKTDRDRVYEMYRQRDEIADVEPEDDDPLSDFGLARGQAVKVRLSPADLPITGTILGLKENRLRVYVKGQDVPVPFDLVQIRVNGQWEDLL